jgi:two-component system, NarL family, response regulator DegU
MPAAKPVQLTQRQKQILRLVVAGHTSREIALQLGLSVRTIEVHRFHLMGRMGVNNVAQLVLEAHRLQLIRP